MTLSMGVAEIRSGIPSRRCPDFVCTADFESCIAFSMANVEGDGVFSSPLLDVVDLEGIDVARN